MYSNILYVKEGPQRSWHEGSGGAYTTWHTPHLAHKCWGGRA